MPINQFEDIRPNNAQDWDWLHVQHFGDARESNTRATAYEFGTDDTAGDAISVLASNWAPLPDAEHVNTFWDFSSMTISSANIEHTDEEVIPPKPKLR